MKKSDVAEIKKRYKKEGVSFDNLAGCYVDANKNKVCTFNGSFLALGEEEFYKYLDIAKKALGGSIGNNIMEYEFPSIEEGPGGKQQGLMALRDGYNDDNLLNAYYDHVIETYEYVGNYLILIFHDNYDVIKKATDNGSLDESEEVYQYLLIAICPVNLDKPALKYNGAIQAMESRELDWIVCPPMTSILFPAFTERSTDIHSVMVNSKNPKESHPEFVENGLGCEPMKTATEMREEFYEIIKGNFDNEEQAEKAVLSAARDIHDMVKSKFDAGQRTDELSADDIDVILSDNSRFNDDVRQSIVEAYGKLDEAFTADVLVDEALLKKNEDAVHVLELEDDIVELRKRIEAGEFVNTDTADVKIPEAIAGDVKLIDVDGMQCLCIPVEELNVLINGRTIK